MATPKVGSKGGPPIFHHRVLQSQSSQIILAMCRNLNWASNHIQKLVINHFFSSSQNAFNGHCIQKSNFKKGEMCTDAMCCSQVRLGPVSSSHTITEPKMQNYGISGVFTFGLYLQPCLSLKGDFCKI